MAKVFSAPKNIKQPSLNWTSREDNQKQEAAYLEQVKAFAQKRNPNGKEVGKIIRFPVADGYAVYMIAGLTPVELIHIPLGDAWDFPYAHRLTKKDVLEEIRRSEAIKKIFS